MKKGTIVYAKYDNGVWEIKQNQKATVVREYFRNGENHLVVKVEGHPKFKQFETPSVLWAEEMSVVLTDSVTGDMVTIKDLAARTGKDEKAIRSMLRKMGHVKFTKSWIWSASNPQVDLIIGYFKDEAE